MNRAERRAAARRPPQQLMGFKFGVTAPEAEILEEALALWLHQTREDVTNPTPHQVWALERGERLRQAFDAAVGNRPWRDVGAQRVPPTSGLQTVFDLHSQVPCADCMDAGRGVGTSCRTCHHGMLDDHYDGTCDTVIELMWALQEAGHAAGQGRAAGVAGRRG